MHICDRYRSGIPPLSTSGCNACARCAIMYTVCVVVRGRNCFRRKACSTQYSGVRTASTLFKRDSPGSVPLYHRIITECLGDVLANQPWNVRAQTPRQLARIPGILVCATGSAVSFCCQMRPQSTRTTVAPLARAVEHFVMPPPPRAALLGPGTVVSSRALRIFT